MSAGEAEQKTRELLHLLAQAQVPHVVVGGVAAIAWGGADFTRDLDVVIPFDVESIASVMRALAPHRPRHWTRPDLGVVSDPPEYLATFRMLLLLTDLGHIDLLRTCEPIGDYERLHARASIIDIGGHAHDLVDIDDLIAIKEHVARPKDLTTAVQLRAIRSRMPPR